MSLNGYYEARHNAAVLCRMWCRDARYIEARLEAVRGTDIAPQDVVLVAVEAPADPGAEIAALLEDIVTGKALVDMKRAETTRKARTGGFRV